MRINYFFSTWSGKRRHGFSWGNYTVQHLQFLEHFSHNLSQITVGWPLNPNEKQKYHEYMTNLHGTKLNGVPIKVVRTNNDGKSYGQFSKAITEYPDFDYYIYTEDDYVPVIDNFDRLLIEKFETSNCGYLCGYAEERGTGPFYAAVSWGVINKKSISKVIEKFGKIPFMGRQQNQIVFSRSFVEVGLEIKDMTDEYQVPYDSSQGIKYFGRGDKLLIVPIEYAKRNKLANIEYQVLFDENDSLLSKPMT